MSAFQVGDRVRIRLWGLEGWQTVRTVNEYGSVYSVEGLCLVGAGLDPEATPEILEHEPLATRYLRTAQHYLRTAQHYHGAPIGTEVDANGPLGHLPDRGFRAIGNGRWRAITTECRSDLTAAHLAGARRRIRKWGTS